MLSQYDRREKFKQIRTLLVEIDIDESRNDYYERGLDAAAARANAETTIIARCDLGNALEFIRKAERRLQLRDGEIKH